DAPVTLGEVPGQTRHLVQLAQRRFLVAVRTERGDVAVNAITAKRHSGHSRLSSDSSGPAESGEAYAVHGERRRRTENLRFTTVAHLHGTCIPDRADVTA